MNLFYSPEISANAPLLLPEEEAVHCLRVLRMKKGDKIFFTDGKGMFYQGEIISDPDSHRGKKCLVKIIRSFPDPATPSTRGHLTIAIAPTKNISRFEWFLEKVTEIGCDEIIPIICHYSQRSTVKTERLNKVMISALKQCLKSRLPKLHEPRDFKTFIASSHSISSTGEEIKARGGAIQKFIGHIPELDESEFPPKNPQGKLLSESLIPDTNSKIVVCIGPEGGFSEEEVALALQNNFIMVSFGNSRLRVETAGVVACSQISGMTGW